VERSKLTLTVLCIFTSRVLARHFDVVVVDDIPIMTLANHNEARRFVAFVDELYEAKTLLMCSAATSPDELFLRSKGNGVEYSFVDSDEEGLAVDHVVHEGLAAGVLASVRDLSFALVRAASRIRQLTSRKWWERRL